MSITVDSLFKSMRESLQSTARFLEDETASSSGEVQLHLDLAVELNRYFNSILWINEKGDIRNVAPNNIELRGSTVSPQITQSELEARKPFITAPYIASTGRLIIVIAEPFLPKMDIFKVISQEQFICVNKIFCMK